MSLPPARVRPSRGLEAHRPTPEDLLAQLPPTTTYTGLSTGEQAAFDELRLFLMREFEVTSALTAMLVHNLANVMWQMDALEKTRGSILRSGIVDALARMGMFGLDLQPERPELYRAGDPAAIASVEEEAQSRGIEMARVRSQALAASASRMHGLENMLATLERRKLRLIRDIDYRGALSVAMRLRRLDVALKERALAALNDAAA